MEPSWYSVIWIGSLTFTKDTELSQPSKPSKSDKKISCKQIIYLLRSLGIVSLFVFLHHLSSELREI